MSWGQLLSEHAADESSVKPWHTTPGWSWFWSVLLPRSSLPAAQNKQVLLFVRMQSEVKVVQRAAAKVDREKVANDILFYDFPILKIILIYPCLFTCGAYSNLIVLRRRALCSCAYFLKLERIGGNYYYCAAVAPLCGTVLLQWSHSVRDSVRDPFLIKF